MKKRAIIFIFLTAILMGSTFPIQKIGLTYVNPLVYIFFRFLIATIVSFFIFKKGNFFYSFILGLVLSIGYISQIIGITYTSATKAGFITSQYIIFIPFFSFLIEKEKINFYQGVSFLFSIMGSYLISGGINSFNFGDFLMIICAISFALHIVLITKFSKKINEDRLLTYQFLTVSIITFIISILYRVDYKINLFSFLTIIYSAIIGSVIVIFLQLKYQKHIGSNLTALIFLIQPIFSAFLSFVILHEQLMFKQIIGAIILLLSIILSSSFK
ncbi:DMT family transporter [Marinitoga arctica]